MSHDVVGETRPSSAMTDVFEGSASMWRDVGAGWLVRAAALAVLLATAAGLIEHRAGTARAADAALHHATLGIIVPLFALAVFRRAHGRGVFLDAHPELLGMGMNRRRVTVGRLGWLWACCAGCALLTAVTSMLAAGGAAGADVAMGAAVGLTGGLLYAAFLTIPTLLGAGPVMRLMVVGLDWVVGSTEMTPPGLAPRTALLSLGDLAGAGAPGFWQVGTMLALLVCCCGLLARFHIAR